MINRETLSDIKDRFEEINRMMAEPEVATNPARMKELGREHTSLAEVVKAIDRYERMLAERDDLRQMVKVEKDEELAEMARAELAELEHRLPAVEDDLRMKLVPRDPEDA